MSIVALYDSIPKRFFFLASNIRISKMSKRAQHWVRPWGLCRGFGKGFRMLLFKMLRPFGEYQEESLNVFSNLTISISAEDFLWKGHKNSLNKSIGNLMQISMIWRVRLYF